MAACVWRSLLGERGFTLEAYPQRALGDRAQSEHLVGDLEHGRPRAEREGLRRSRKRKAADTERSSGLTLLL